MTWWSYRDVVFSVDVEEKVVALTFDDGPNPPHTEALLELLENRGVKATFFLQGANVEAYPDSVLAVLAAGHEIGNHTYSHPALFDLGVKRPLEELKRTQALITELTGEAPVMFRAPVGAQGIGLARAVDQLGLLSVGAYPAGWDWEVFDPQLIAESILTEVEPGNLILLHDGDGDAMSPTTQESRAGSVAATGIIIDTLRERGYRFVTAGELLAMAK